MEILIGLGIFILIWIIKSEFESFLKCQEKK